MSPALAAKRKATSFWRLPRFVKAWFLPSVILYLFSKVAISLVPFRRLSSLLGESNGIAPFLPVVESSQRARVAKISMLVNLVARYMPLDRSCLPQAITARILLGIYGLPYCVFFGVRRKESGIDAHAWVFSGARCVCGGRRSFWKYRVLGVFVTPGLIPMEHQHTGKVRDQS